MQRAILKTTRGLLGTVGYSRLTIEGIAAKAGCGKTTIYRWWPTKGDLVLEAVGSDIEIGVVPNTGSTAGDLQVAIEQLMTTFSKRLAGIVIFAAIATAADDPTMAAAFRDRYVYPWRVSAAEAIARGIERGDLPPDTDVQFLLDVIVGTVFQRTLVLREPMTEGLVEQILALVLRIE
ncbi:MAG: TetR/AcrR family transcriptional regulator [Hyphomicrobiales bacterium]|nr:TetR/AcrR family transcriptional regulator [Hyphomicrobiales bacterium]